MSTFEAIQELNGRQRELAQAIARPSRFRYVVLVTGVGETRLIGKKGIQFGTAMLEEPSFSFGLQAVTPLNLGELPLASAIVLNWQTDKRGMYRGVDMGFRIESYAVKPQLKFWLTFEGSALRTAEGLA